MKVKIFTEGGGNIGFGHLSRCISLYDEVSSRGITVEVFVSGDVNNIGFIKERNVINENWLNKDYLNNNITTEDYVIVDSYNAEKVLYEIIASKAKKTLYIDDYNRIDYPKGIIVNPALDTCNITYNKSFENDLLIGSKYVILRSSFIGLNNKVVRKKVQRILVMLGGTDVKSITEQIIYKICNNERQNIIFDIIVPNSQFEQMKKYENQVNLNIYTNINEDEMSQLMINSDFAITAAGQSIYELMATNTPFIAIKVIDNQDNNIQSIKKHISSKIVIDCNKDNFLEDLKEIYEKMKLYDTRKLISDKMKNIIDGAGRKRIIDALIGEN